MLLLLVAAVSLLLLLLPRYRSGAISLSPPSPTPTQPTPHQTETTTTITTPSNTPHAFATLIAGVSPTGSYRGYLQNAIVTALQLKELHTDPHFRYDFVVMIMFDKDTSWTALPAPELKILNSLDVKVRYVTTFFGDPSFYTAMMAKFRICDLPYETVVFMDGDVLPLQSLQPFLDGTIPFADVLVMAWKVGPAHGGFFVVRPDKEMFADMEALIMKQQKGEGDAPWDTNFGWGDSLSEGWLNVHGKVGGNDWAFNGGHADQGFLYWYFRFVRKSITIALKDRVIEYSGDSEVGSDLSSEEVFGVLNTPMNGVVRVDGLPNVPPYNTFYHFTGKGKPWLKEAPKPTVAATVPANALSLWYDLLRRVKVDYLFDVDVENLHKQEMSSPLGYFSTHKNILS